MPDKDIDTKELLDKIEARGKQQEANIEEKLSERKDLSPEEVQKALSRAEQKALIVQLLARGYINDRLEIKDGDPNKHYEWIREHDTDMERMLALNFVVETEAGSEYHKTGDNRRRVGDVILMSTSKENYEIIQEVKRELKAKKSVLGKREYLQRARSAGGQDAPILDPLNVGQEEA